MIEIVIALVIMLGLIAIVTTAGIRMLKSADITQLISERKMYSEAISEFYDIKKRLPGDVPLSEMQGDLNIVAAKNNITKVISETPSSQEIIMMSKIITGRKGMLAFQQMGLAGLIPTQNLDVNYQIQSTNGCLNSSTENFSSIRNKLLPTSKYSKNIVWIMSADSDLYPALQYGPKNSVIYNSSLYSRFTSKPRLTLFMASNYIGNGITDCYVDVNNATAGFMGSGAISADISAEIDLKIDDGKPSYFGGSFVAENDQNGNGCTTTESDISQRQYLKNSDQSGLKSCILTFLVDLIV